MTKSRLTILLFLVIFHSNEAQLAERVLGVPVDSAQVKAQNECVGDNLFQCTVGCDALMVCEAGNPEPLLTQTCDTRTPYCESSATSAACQADPGTECQASTTFECTGTGYYPGKV